MLVLLIIQRVCLAVTLNVPRNLGCYSHCIHMEKALEKAKGSCGLVRGILSTKV